MWDVNGERQKKTKKKTKTEYPVGQYKGLLWIMAGSGVEAWWKEVSDIFLISLSHPPGKFYLETFYEDSWLGAHNRYQYLLSAWAIVTLQPGSPKGSPLWTQVYPTSVIAGQNTGTMHMANNVTSGVMGGTVQGLSGNNGLFDMMRQIQQTNMTFLSIVSGLS